MVINGKTIVYSKQARKATNLRYKHLKVARAAIGAGRTAEIWQRAETKRSHIARRFWCGTGATAVEDFLQHCEKSEFENWPEKSRDAYRQVVADVRRIKVLQDEIAAIQ